MLKAQWCKYILNFIRPARTSRSVMTYKPTYFIRLYDDSNPSAAIAYGECALFPGLSSEDVPDYEDVLAKVCLNPQEALYCNYSSIRFGFESALFKEADSNWLTGDYGIYTNGLIWMGDKRSMEQQVRAKLDAGFKVLKLKIGGIDFEEECAILKDIRKAFPVSDLEIRLDANGAFNPDNALEKLKRLSDFNIHSIEQPIKAGQREAMAAICSASPIPIALDEELIGCRSAEDSKILVDTINPQFLILKPSLCGGILGSRQYIDIANERNIKFWFTSALESNIGLFAVASLASVYHPVIPQGLGTGLLYNNNIESPMLLRDCRLWYNPEMPWANMEELLWHQ